MFDIASTETMEVLDRVIGKNQTKLSANDAFEVATIRPKILQVLLKRLSHDFEKLSLEQIVLLADVVSKDNDKELIEKL